MTKRPVPTSGMTFRSEEREGGRMSNLIVNCILVIIALVCLLLLGVELSQAAIISLLFGIFYTLGDIYHELTREK